MDVKDEDTSKESMENHMTYYKSLTKIISNIQEEGNQELDPTKRKHLDNRIEAIERDKQRIRNMFPNITKEEWDGNTN